MESVNSASQDIPSGLSQVPELTQKTELDVVRPEGKTDAFKDTFKCRTFQGCTVSTTDTQTQSSVHNDLGILPNLQLFLIT